MLDMPLGVWLGALSFSTMVTAPTQATTFEQLAQRCAPNVHPTTLQKIVTVESSHNPFAIGVVNGSVRQPKTLIEAVATAQRLHQQGYNFSLGLTQVNRYNLAKQGENYTSIFEPCRNLKAGAAILTDCYLRAKPLYPDSQQALRAALSCYYSGNFTRGFKAEGGRSYVQRVVEAQADPQRIVPAIENSSRQPSASMASPAPATVPKPGKRQPVTTQPATPRWIDQYAHSPSSSAASEPPPSSLSSFVTFY